MPLGTPLITSKQLNSWTWLSLAEIEAPNLFTLTGEAWVLSAQPWGAGNYTIKLLAQTSPVNQEACDQNGQTGLVAKEFSGDFAPKRNSTCTWSWMANLCRITTLRALCRKGVVHSQATQEGQQARGRGTQGHWKINRSRNSSLWIKQVL